MLSDAFRGVFARLSDRCVKIVGESENFKLRMRINIIKIPIFRVFPMLFRKFPMLSDGYLRDFPIGVFRREAELYFSLKT